ncbi:hypothetical protein J4E83_008991 [Alternaria metachromatica]|uniref:uncharacterized protein n=1 Tax=Alternaria metachromatica TaxID=283354 RepID=UPI0020C567E7|nr:uncharacterized protein J4E83_008991 [Alternaria metachromatica]KAI4608555.1 hypothetical protein J4E83_008991 [Alternaria metachromatica]
MAKLTDLSNELLYSIVAHLATGRCSDVRALWQLCKTSRALAAVAQPALYTCVVLGQSMPETMRSLELFLRTCVERPKLGKKTRSLTLHYHRPAPYKGPDLMRLDYIPLLRYPSFSSFSTEIEISDGNDVHPATNLLTPSAIELWWSLGPLATMRQALDACPRLETFRFVIPDDRRYGGMLPDDIGSEPLVSPRDLGIALLEKQKATLKTLELHYNICYDTRSAEFQEDMEQHGEDSFHYVYPSFRDFEMLSHITMQFGKLTKLCHLPESLKCLKLQDCHFDVDLSEDCLRDMLQLKDTWCPLIEQLSLQGYNLLDAIDMIREVERSLDLRIFELHGKGLVSFRYL